MRTANTPVPSRHALANVAPVKRRGERGAVLVNAAIAMIGLISFSALVVDYGILWSARRQAQNAADAGAMAAAVSLGLRGFRQSARWPEPRRSTRRAPTSSGARRRTSPTPT